MVKINRFSVAPMMDLTDRHCRYFHRILSKNALLYTEMVTSKAILYGDTRKLLKFDPMEKPLALQVGGSDPIELAEVASIAEELGFDEINLNVGCPSSRVKSGMFGAVLMKDPKLVCRCIEQMKNAVNNVPVSVKCRIGVDNQDPKVILPNFVSSVSKAGADYFIIHARKALLSGLSPKQNRKIPPLDYAVVDSVKKSFPDISICLNGGITSLAVAKELLDTTFNGVMLGRASYYYPEEILLKVDSLIYGSGKSKTMFQAVSELLPYIEKELDTGSHLSEITRHLMRAFVGHRGARQYRKHLTENSFRKEAKAGVFVEALSIIENENSRNLCVNTLI